MPGFSKGFANLGLPASTDFGGIQRINIPVVLAPLHIAHFSNIDGPLMTVKHSASSLHGSLKHLATRSLYQEACKHTVVFTL